MVSTDGLLRCPITSAAGSADNTANRENEAQSHDVFFQSFCPSEKISPDVTSASSCGKGMQALRLNRDRALQPKYL